MIKLDYYYFPSCPFCQMVDSVIKELKIKVEYKNIHEDRSSLEKLFKDTGRQTVPCLYIDGEPMHESRDIIQWLETNKSKLEKVS